MIGILLCVPAHAGDSPSCIIDFTDHPADGAMDVVINPILFSPHGSYSETFSPSYELIVPPPPELRPADQPESDPIALHEVIVVDDAACAFRAYAPDEALQSDTSYTIKWGGFENGFENSFTTGSQFEPSEVELEIDPDNPCVAGFSEEEHLVLRIEQFKAGISHGVRIITPLGGSIRNCTEFPVRVYDRGGGFAELPANESSTDDASEGNEPIGCRAAPSRSVRSALLFALLNIL